MKILLDTHTFIWYATGDKRLSKEAISLIESSEQKLLSAASIWEMAIKVSVGKLHFKKPFEEIIKHQFVLNQYRMLHAQQEHFFELSKLPFHHRDPFDRLIIVQAQIDNIPIIGKDEIFDRYGVKRIW